MKSACIVSTFPPAACGIAAYAEQQARRMEEEGIRILRISPKDPGKEAQLCEFSTFHGILHFLWLILSRSKESLTIHYADRFYFRKPEHSSNSAAIRASIRFFQTFALAVTALIMGKKGQVIVHEINLDPTMPWAIRVLRAAALRFFGTLCFHSAAHRDAVIGSIPQLSGSRTEIITHGRFLKRLFKGSQSEARASLGLAADPGPMLLCIGFWNPSKGFEDAIDAFFRASIPDAKLYIVGGPKCDSEGIAYADMIKARITQGSGINLIQTKLSDEMFDQWLQASDAVILPYHAISSSGVAARASLYGKKLIMRKLKAFEEEYPEGIIFSTTEELSRILIILSESAKNKFSI